MSRQCPGILLMLVCAAQWAGGAEPAQPTAVVDFLAADRDTSVSPGDDFFEYANGGWLKRNPIPATEHSWGIDFLVREQLSGALRELNERAAAGSAPAGSDERKIGDFWATAMDAENARRAGARPLYWELVRIDRAATLSQVLDVAFALQPLDSNILFRFWVDQDWQDNRIVTAQIRQDGLGLPERDFYFNSDASIAGIRAAYVIHIQRMLVLLGRNESAAKTAATNIVAFETRLAQASRKLEDIRDPVSNYHRMSPEELTRKRTPSIDWRSRLAAWKLHPRFMVVGQPDYFDALERTLRQTPVPVLKDYMRYHLVARYAEYLSPALEAEDFDFNQRTLAGQKEPRPRWKRVLETENAAYYRLGGVQNPLGMLVGRRYVAEYFPATTKQRYSNLVTALVAAYRERIGRLDWMSAATKAKALEKLAALERKIGYPDRWPDYSALVVGRDSYCENVMNISRWRFDHMLQRFGRPVDRSEWMMTPQTYNAYYHPIHNEIVFPAAIFIVPGVRDADLDDAVVYGSAGAVIGHEITHGFDDQGRKFDASGNLHDWWMAEDATQFEQRAEAMVRQFDAYEPLPGFHINGKASLGENIADFGGLLVALDAFKQTQQYRAGEPISGLTPLQRFFLGYASSWMVERREEQIRRALLSDFHTPEKWRVLGPLSNIPDFYEAFDVKPTQPMWRSPEQRVSIW
jgi:putative endopeptidase